MESTAIKNTLQVSQETYELLRHPHAESAATQAPAPATATTSVQASAEQSEAEDEQEGMCSAPARRLTCSALLGSLSKVDSSVNKPPHRSKSSSNFAMLKPTASVVGYEFSFGHWLQRDLEVKGKGSMRVYMYVDNSDSPCRGCKS